MTIEQLFTLLTLICFSPHSNDMTSRQNSSAEKILCNVAPFFYHHSVVITTSSIRHLAKCSTKPLSKLVTCILSAVKTGLQSYCDTSYSWGGVNQMSVLKNSKDMLEYIQPRSLSACNCIKTFDYSTLYTTIPHSKLKDRLRELVQLCFI